MAAPSSSTLGGSGYSHHAHRRASSVPNLRERPSGSPQRVALHTPWADEVLPPPPAIAPLPQPPIFQVPDAPIAAMPPPQAPRAVRSSRSWRFWWRRLTRFFGYGRGNEARKELVTLIFTLCFGITQIVAIVLLLIVGARSRSKTDSALNEWDACNKPLPAWAIIWCVRVLVGFVTSVWAWRISKYRTRSRDAERGTSPSNPVAVQQALPDTVTHGTAAQPTGNATTATTAQRSNALNRLTTFSSLAGLVWFIVAHSFLYTSLTTCKVSSPHIWWLVFGIVCIGYIVVAEVVLVGIVVFVLVPMIFLIINVVLVCLGRRPLLPGNDIHPEVPKLSPRLVDRIPLVLYIPPPPVSASYLPAVPIAAHTYPPNAKFYSQSSTSPRRPLFKFLRRKRKATGKRKQLNDGADNKPQSTNVWEDKWEKGEYPFVRLDENRAACAICLMDFEPPKKVNPSVHEAAAVDPTDVPGLVNVSSRDEYDEEGPIGAEDDDDNANLRLQDAGDGVQPLRLLSCGHVFHKTCLDPWLVDVSGRCPTCQQRVEIPQQEEPNTRWQRRRRG